MTNKPPGYQSLSRRIVIQFCGFTLLISAAYGVVSLVLMYMLEDSFIDQELRSEGNFLAAQFERTGSWPAPRKNTVQLHFSRATFPEAIRQMAMEEPKRLEFFGEQQHYHAYALKGYDQVWLIAEVSDELIVRKVRPSVLTFLTISTTLVTLVACCVAWLIGHRTSRPLQELADLVDGALVDSALVDGVAPQQIPHGFANRFPNNEIGILARTLEGSFQGVNHALEREKCFTRDVSHELRTPLAVIKNALELRQHQPASDRNNSLENSIAQRVAAAAEQMDKTVSTLLMLAREENAEAHKQAVNLLAVVEQSVLDNRSLLIGKQLQILIDDSCNTEVVVQPGMLKVLLDNLLSNAFQYTQHGEVRVVFRAGKLVVTDTGPGIEAGISAQLTQVGIKGSHSTGFGFGMSIVKRLCEHQNWHFTVDSGQGTSVSVTL